METYLFAALICTCVAKLDPEAFKSASISMTVHKSYIINLRDMSFFCTLGSSAVRVLAWTPRKQTMERNQKSWNNWYLGRCLASAWTPKHRHYIFFHNKQQKWNNMKCTVHTQTYAIFLSFMFARYIFMCSAVYFWNWQMQMTTC